MRKKYQSCYDNKFFCLSFYLVIGIPLPNKQFYVKIYQFFWVTSGNLLLAPQKQTKQNFCDTNLCCLVSQKKVKLLHKLSNSVKYSKKLGYMFIFLDEGNVLRPFNLFLIFLINKKRKKLKERNQNF